MAAFQEPVRPAFFCWRKWLNIASVADSQTLKSIDLAKRHHREGRLGEAEQAYRQALVEQPDAAEALYGLGLVLFAGGKAGEALPLVQRAVASEPRRADYHYNLGVLLSSLNRRGEAMESYKQSLALRPNFAEALYNMAALLLAEDRPQEAVNAYRRILQMSPETGGVYVNLGIALNAAGDPSGALEAFERACALQPDLAEAQFNRGNSLRVAGRLPEAIQAFREAVRIRPNWPDALHNLGSVLRATQQIEPAMAAFRQTLALWPDHIGAICNIASVHLLQGKVEEAMAGYRRAIQLDPNCAAAYSSLGGALFDIGRREEGIAAYRRAISLCPNDAVMHWSLASALLATGRWEEGWEEFEWRVAVFRSDLNRGFAQPQWDGSDIQGKMLLLHAEGGHGDAIQFARYVPMAAERGATIILECHPALLELFKQVPGVWHLTARGSPLPEFDVHAPLIGLPRIFRTRPETIPSRESYLTAPADRVDKFRARIPRNSRLKVGLVWAGRPIFADVRTRTLDVFAPLAKVPNVDFFSLQKGEEASQKPPEGMNLVDLSAEIDDFADAAGLLAHLDLLISVDTAAAHLAGAMGKPVWLLTFNALNYWRWLLDREDTQWYPSMRLFRLPYDGNWRVPISRMAEQLKLLASERAPR